MMILLMGLEKIVEEYIFNFKKIAENTINVIHRKAKKDCPLQFKWNSECKRRNNRSYGF